MEMLHDTESLEYIWQSHVHVANQHMQDKRYDEAQDRYIAAMAISAQMLRQAWNYTLDPEALYTYVISCHNLAENLFELGAPQQAELLYRRAFDEMLCTIEDATLPIEFRFEATKCLKLAGFEIYTFYRALNQPIRAGTVLRSAISYAQNFLALSL